MVISLMWLSPVVATVVKRASHEGRERERERGAGVKGVSEKD